MYIVINNIDINLYNELKKSYFGGHVDMYVPAGPRLTHATSKGFAKPEDNAIVPHNNPFVYEYDVNSLYPFSMLKDIPYEILDTPVNNLNDFFGFFFFVLLKLE